MVDESEPWTEAHRTFDDSSKAGAVISCSHEAERLICSKGSIQDPCMLGAASEDGVVQAFLKQQLGSSL